MSEKSAIRLMAETVIKQAIRETVAQELIAITRRDPTDEEIENQHNYAIRRAISDGPGNYALRSHETYQALWKEINAFGKQNQTVSATAEAVMLLALEWAISDELKAKDLTREASNEEQEEQRKNRLFGVITDVTKEHGDDSPKTTQAVWDEIKTFNTFETWNGEHQTRL